MAATNTLRHEARQQRVRSSNSADVSRLPAGTKTVELRKKPCPSYLETHTVSLMETGTKLIRGTAIIRESHRLAIQEKAAFADVLQARRAASHEQDLLPVLTGTRLRRRQYLRMDPAEHPPASQALPGPPGPRSVQNTAECMQVPSWAARGSVV